MVAPDEALRRLRRVTGAFQIKPERSPAYLLGGVDVAVDAVGSKQSLETALHATRAGGRVVLSGMPARGGPVRGLVPRARGGRVLLVGAARDRGSTAGARSRWRRSCWPATRWQLAKTVASYPLHRWREALDHAHGAGRLGTVKVAFDPKEQQVTSREKQ